MKALTDHGSLLLVLGLGASVGCAGTTPVAGITAASETNPGTSMGTSGTETTSEENPLAPWYGPWYAVDPLTSINEPMWWGSGGDALAFELFELRADSATITVENCLFGFRQFEYITAVDDDGVVVLEPVGGTHEYPPYGNTERLYIEPGADCSSLMVREVRKSGEEFNLFWPSLARGELCVEECARGQGWQGLLSDCGTPVPWECSQ